MATTLSNHNVLHSLQIKVMYWGPGEAGKTTNFLRLQEIFHKYKISQGFSIATTDDRTLWNDSVHFRFVLEQFHLELIVLVATTTGQERFLSTREYILENADGVIFVGDSQPDQLANNIRSFEEVVAFTHHNHIPILVQLNKRDLKNRITLHEFKDALGLPQLILDPANFQIVYEAIAGNPEDPVGVRVIFLDLIQKILQQKLIKG